MSWWNRLLGGKSRDQHGPQRVDYLSEAIALERQGDFDAALTSYRLALRDQPNNTAILQNIAIAYSKAGRLEDAIRAYRRAIEAARATDDRDAARAVGGAHYGLAFLLLKRGDLAGAMGHLESFLSGAAALGATEDAEMERWIRHAQQTLAGLREGRVEPSGPASQQLPQPPAPPPPSSRPR
jgi:tetratricopeptide (TPR) repeat protein